MYAAILPVGLKGCFLHWGSPAQCPFSPHAEHLVFFLSALIACISFIPMVDVAKILFFESANRELTWFFPQRMNNTIMLWAMLNGIVGLILFYLSYTLFGKKNGITKKMLGLSISFIQIFLTYVGYSIV